MKTRPLTDLAVVIRSKNAKPFRVTFDIIFSDPRAYEHVKRTGVISRDSIAALYGISPEEILSIHEFDPGLAIKFTIRRRVPQGSPGDTDIYGCQQHAHLLDVEVPWP